MTTVTRDSAVRHPVESDGSRVTRDDLIFNMTNHKPLVVSYLVVLFLAGLLYTATCAPTILWQDSGIFVHRIWHNDIQGDLGLALSHPLYIMIGIAAKSIQFGEFAWRINLISAVCGALTVANLFLLLRLLLGKVVPAVIGAVTLAVSWTLWQHSVIAEVYTLYTAQMLAELIVLLLYIRTGRVRYLYLLGLLNGLAMANHLLAVIPLLCYAVFVTVLLVRREIGLKNLAVVIVLWIIAALPYEYLIVKNIVLSGQVWSTLHSAAFGRSWQGGVLNASITMKMVFENVIFVLLNFPTPNLVFFFVGLPVLRSSAVSRRFANIMLVLLALFFAFAFRYTVVDRYVFFLPFYCLAAVLIAVGADAFLGRYKHRAVVFVLLAFTLLPVPAYYLTPAVAGKIYKGLGQMRQLPYRDSYKYFLQPWKSGYRGAQRFAAEALDMVEKNAIICADGTTINPLRYMQELKGQRNDVKIVSAGSVSEKALFFNKEAINQLIEGSAVYVVSPMKGYCPQFLLEDYDFVQTGILWKVVQRKQNE